MTMPDSESSRRYRIGYAMAPKKVNSVIQGSLIQLAAKQGIDLVPVNLDKPLVEQGHFDCVVHKLYGQNWRNQLHEFSAKYPDAVVIDQLDDIEKLHNRITMLQVVNDLSFPHQISESFGIPRQILVQDSDLLLDRIKAEGLKFPVIAKSLLANGTADSHQMFLVFNQDGLNDLNPPFVLQEFVNHGGVIFKVYVAGDQVRCVKRRSLPDISDDKLGAMLENLLPFSQISNLTDQDQSDDSVAKLIEEAEMPPPSFATAMAQALRRALKLHLFNFDMIRDSRDANRYLVIDINYFPGYAKLPSYETMLTDFFLDIVQHKQTIDSSSLDIEKTPDAGSNGQEPA